MDLRLDPRRTALVMVDMQNDFCHPRGLYARAMERIEPLGLTPRLVTEGIPAMRALLEAARRVGLFIVHTRIERDAAPDAAEAVHQIVPATFQAVIGVEGGPALTPGSWGAETHEELAPLPGEYLVRKRSFSAFYGTDLETALRRRGVKTLVLAGTITYACILHTAFDANVRDFDVVVASDASASWAADLQAPTLRIVDLILGTAVPSGEVIEALALGNKG
jgi:ureidoacrylate peracid hydrolase